MENVINLDMKRLDAIFSKVALLNYYHWVVDVQGAVFKVLVGAGKLLENCDSMMIEVSTREVYNNGVRFNELNEFLEQRGFFPIWIPREGVHQNLMYLRRPS